MIKAGIIGGAGYVARELTALLARHPEVELVAATSNSQEGKVVAEFLGDAAISEGLVFKKKLEEKVDVLFLCGGHGQSAVYLAENEVPEQTVVIDLSTDFRTDASFVYGLPEVNATSYDTAGGSNGVNRIANPGCFATAIQLALLPALKVIAGPVHVHAITGSTGAGQALSETGHFSWRQDNLSTYKVFEHQHLTEILHTFSQQGNPLKELNFIPLRGPFTRGIFATVYFDCNLTQKEVLDLYNEFYKDAPFTQVQADAVDLKQVVNTNFCLLNPQVINGKLIVTAAIDNLLKGAAGQAVQNMNIRFGISQKSGLELKPTFF